MVVGSALGSLTRDGPYVVGVSDRLRNGVMDGEGVVGWALDSIIVGDGLVVGGAVSKRVTLH